MTSNLRKQGAQEGTSGGCPVARTFGVRSPRFCAYESQRKPKEYGMITVFCFPRFLEDETERESEWDSREREQDRKTKSEAETEKTAE